MLKKVSFAFFRSKSFSCTCSAKSMQSMHERKKSTCRKLWKPRQNFLLLKIIKSFTSHFKHYLQALKLFLLHHFKISEKKCILSPAKWLFKQEAFMNRHQQPRLKLGSIPAWQTARPKQKRVKGFKAAPVPVGRQQSDLMATSHRATLYSLGLIATLKQRLLPSFIFQRLRDMVYFTLKSCEGSILSW